jgi:hypothetical protein
MFVWADMYLIRTGKYHGLLSTWVIPLSLIVLLLAFNVSPQSYRCHRQAAPQVPDNGHVRRFVPFGYICIQHQQRLRCPFCKDYSCINVTGIWIRFLRNTRLIFRTNKKLNPRSQNLQNPYLLWKPKNYYSITTQWHWPYSRPVTAGSFPHGLSVPLVSIHWCKVRLEFEEVRLGWRICGQKRDKVRGSLRKVHNDELRNMYSSPSIIRMIKSRKMASSGYVA